MAEESGKANSESMAGNLGLNEVRGRDDIQEVSLGDDIFKLDSGTTKPDVKVIVLVNL